jgi:hypothetical protein
MNITQAEIDLDERRRVAGIVGLSLLFIAATFGGAAARGHLVYGDWHCGFATCVVSPGWRKKKKKSGR